MIFVIGPLVQGARRRRDWLLQTGAYVGAMMVSASLLGAFVSAIGRFVLGQGREAWLVLAVAVLVYGAAELRLLRLPLPESTWQVPRRWMEFGPLAYPVMYGSAVGLGFLTRAPFASFHAMLAWQLVMRSIGLGALMGVIYAVGRAGATLVVGIANGGPSASLIRATWWVVERRPVWHLANGLSLGLAGAILFVGAIR